MKRLLSASLVYWILLAFMATILASNIPTIRSFEQYGLIGILFIGVTAWVLYFSVLLPEIEIVPAHVVGLVSLLAYPLDAFPTMLWAAAVGGLIGGLILVIRNEDWGLRRLNPRTARNALLIAARLTISLFIGAEVYQRVGGLLPLAFPLIKYTLPYFFLMLANATAYVLVFTLELFVHGRDIRALLRDPVLIFLFLGLVFVPLPFAIWSASLIVLVESGIWFFAIGTSAVAVGLNVVSVFWHKISSQQHEMRSLRAVSVLTQSELKVNTLIERLYQEVSQVLDVDNFLLALYEVDTERLRFPLVVHRGQPVTAQDVGIEEHMLLERMLQSREPLLISYKMVGRDANTFDSKTNLLLESWLGVPLIAAGRLLGGMTVMSHNPNRHFKPNDQHLLGIVAASASIAIDNAQFYEQQTLRATQLNALNQALSQVTETLSPERVIETVLQAAPSISQADAAAVFMLTDDEPRQLRLANSSGLSGNFGQEPFELLLNNLKAEPVLIENVHQDVRAVRYLDLLANERKTAWVELPMVVGEQEIGVLALYFNDAQAFTSDGIEILRAFANQAAQAIQNARQYSTTDQQLERRADQMYALAALGRQLTANMNLRQICSLILRRAAQLTETSTAFIVLEEQGDLLLIDQLGYPASLGLNPLMISQSITGLVLSGSQPFRADDLKAMPARRAPLLPNTRAQLTVPIVRGSTTLGALTLEHENPRAYTEGDSYFVTQIASQATMALDNARLFRQITDSVERLHTILNTMTEALILVESNGTISLINPRVRLLGIEPADLVNQNLERSLAEDAGLAGKLGFEHNHRLNNLVKALRDPQNWQEVESFTYTLEKASQTLYLRREVLLVGNKEEGSLGLLLVFHDETEQVELDMARRDLSNMIVHDLRSPLTAVTTGLTLLREAVNPDNKMFAMTQRTTDISQRAIRKLLGRVDSLLDISRMESGLLQLDRRPTKLRPLVEAVIHDLSVLSQDMKIQINVEIPADMPLFDVDSDKIERVIQNLIDNALKFTPPNGKITVSAAANAQNDRLLRVQVADTGPGIPPEYRQTLFDRFVQVKGRQSKRRGTGLGLTFCKLTVESHGGRIWVEDNPGGGSIFIFTLPAAAETALTD